MKKPDQKLRELPHKLQCIRCGRLTSRTETTQRIFNTGACGHCGGQLEVVRGEQDKAGRDA